MKRPHGKANPIQSQTRQAAGLAVISIFRDLRREELESIHRLLRYREFPTGATLFSAGHDSKAVYLLLRGKVKICLQGTESKEVIFAICEEGDVLGEINAIDSQNHSATVVTLEPCMAAWMSDSDFLELLHTIPQISFNLNVNLVHRLRLATEHVETLAIDNVAGRVASKLLSCARLYGEQTAAGETLIPFRLSQIDLAQMTGATRTSVNHVLQQYERNGYIARNDHFRITVRKPEALCKHCRHYPLPEPREPE